MKIHETLSLLVVFSSVDKFFAEFLTESDILFI